MAKRHHPDTAATEELATSRRLNEAYRIQQD
jgi:DnaJ-class molecular chaperone